MSSRLNVNKAWLESGEGDMFGAPPPDTRLAELTDIFARLNAHFQRYILEQIRALDKVQEKKPGDQNAPAEAAVKPAGTAAL